eukprot:191685_1
MCKQKKPFFFTFTSLQWLPTKQTIQPQSPPRSQWTSIQRNLSSIRSPNRSNQHQNGIQSMGARIRFKSRYLQCVERSLGGDLSACDHYGSLRAKISWSR